MEIIQKFTQVEDFIGLTPIAFHYMNNTIPCKNTMNEGSPFEFSTFKGQFVIVVRQVLADEKFRAISQTNC